MTEEKKVGKKKTILMGVGVVVLLLVGFLAYDQIFYVSTDNAQIRANTVILSARVGGFITKVHVEENQSVKAGTILAEIDPKDYKSRSSQAENETLSLQAKVQDAKKNYLRILDLANQGAVPLQQKDSAYANYLELERKLKALESQSDLSKINLEETLISAPKDGVVAKKSAEVGMLATPGSPLFAFVSSESRWVIANFKETDLSKISVGKRADIEVDAIPRVKFEGVVESLSPATGATFSLLPQDNATGNFTKLVQRVPVRIKIENMSAEKMLLLRAGLSAVVRVHVR